MVVKDMVIQKAVAGDKSGTVGITYYSQIVDKVNSIPQQVWKYIAMRLRDTSNKLSLHHRVTQGSNLRVQYADKVNKNLFSNMKSFDATLKGPTCNAVIMGALVHHDIVTCVACRQRQLSYILILDQ